MTSIGTVTTVGGGYSRWMSDWVDGVLSQTRRPDETVVVVNGDEDDSLVDAEVGRLRRHVPTRLIRLPWTHNWGRARNIAVAATTSEWVHHADVDDVLLPHALSDWKMLAVKADVVAFGWKRLGRVSEGSRRRAYHASCGPSTLRSPGPASGPSPFRRTFWERRPYDDRLPSAWDAALWRGFGWQDARFVPTRRAVLLYRWHPQSLSNSRQAAGDPDHVEQRLQRAATVPPDDVAVVVPWRDRGDPDRRHAWDWLKRRWRILHPGWTVVEADCSAEWNKPEAVNGTVAGLDVRTVVVADADVAVPPDRIRTAVRLAASTPWVVPHGDVCRMTRQATRRLTTSDPAVELPPDPECAVRPYRGTPAGGLFVIGRAQWDRMGGFDPTFRGWGAEDDAFALAADTLLGTHVRLDGPLWHLWHDPGLRSDDPHWKPNRERLIRYRRAARCRQTMAALVSERTGRNV